MKYLSLSEALVIAEAVTGIAAEDLRTVANVNLLDSALNAPRAGYADTDLYPSFAEKAAILAIRIAKNHVLPDGNKRLAWMCLRVFCLENGSNLEASKDEAVSTMLRVASGEITEGEMTHWIATHVVSQ